MYISLSFGNVEICLSFFFINVLGFVLLSLENKDSKNDQELLSLVFISLKKDLRHGSLHMTPV